MRRLGLVAAAAFVATLGLANELGVRLRPALFTVAHDRGWLRHRLDALDPVGRRGDIVLVGTSFSGGSGSAFNKALGRHLVVDRARSGSRLGDELAAAVLGRRAGARLALVELNPFDWARAATVPLITYPYSAESLTGVLSPELAARVRSQLGIEAGLELLADRFAPSRWRISGLASFWREPLVNALFGQRLPELPALRYPGDACEVWRVLGPASAEEGVLDDFVKWVDRERLDTIFFIPQLRRRTIAECGTDTLARLDDWIITMRRRVEAPGRRFVDMSRAVDEGLLVDFGHFADPADFSSLAAAWVPVLNASASK
jgi:hypothetical protein